MKSIRPGLLVKFVECFEYQKNLQFESFSELLNNVLKMLSREIILQKFETYEPWKCYGTLNLISGYWSINKRKEDSTHDRTKRRNFLNDYYQYLMNPVDLKESKFIVYLCSENVYKKELRVLAKNENDLREWHVDTLAMNPEDALSMLALLCVPFVLTITGLMREMRRSIENSAYSIWRAFDPRYKFADEDIINSMIHSSHMKGENESNLIFDGRSGDVFMYNFVENLIDKTCHRISEGICLKYECDLTENFLKEVTIPFLLPFDFSSENVPIIKNLKGQEGSIVNIESIFSVQNESWLDGKFTFKSGENDAIATYKVRNQLQLMDNLATKYILENAILNNTLMTFMVCNETSTNTIVNSELKSYCLSQSIKLLRLTRESETRNYTLSDHFQDLFVEEPKLYAFIFEMDVINAKKYENKLN